MIKILLTCALGAALFAVIAPTPAGAQAMTRRSQPLLHPLFSENAVLQRDRPLTIWGWAGSKADVTVKFGGGERTLRAADDGYWSVPIRPRGADGRAYSLEVSSGKQTETRSNLVFGDVWLCSGQSNMEWPLNNTNDAASEKAAANYPQIRLLSVPQKIAAVPVNDFYADWQVCSPQTVGEFSAVGYFFGRRLNQDLKIPIGLIDSSWGGTPAEAWTSQPALRTLPFMEQPLASLAQSLEDPVGLNEKLALWWQNDIGTKSQWWATDFDDSNWRRISQPGAWEENGYAGFDGAMWYRRDVDIPADWIGQDLTLSLGAIDDNDTTYWNREEVGATEGAGKARVYNINKGRVRAGRNVIIIRVLDTGGAGGLTGPADALFLQHGADKMNLTGEWKMQAGGSLAEMPPYPKPRIDQNSPAMLYNGMIAPLLPGQIKGVIWYQGESNADRATQYQTLLPTMIGDWRAKFGAPMPFYIVQLANFQQPTDDPNNVGWGYLREAQSLTAKNVPDVGIAVITDIGEAGDIHPRNKQDVGLRLALQALKNTYGQKVQADGPTLKSAQVRGGEIALTFDNADGLTLKGDEAHVFAVAGADGKYFWANPTIQGDTIYISTPDVAAPLTARFGFSDNPRANLYNNAGLPASPFRTDES